MFLGCVAWMERKSRLRCSQVVLKWLQPDFNDRAKKGTAAFRAQ